MNKMPECFCSEEGMTSCDWVLTASLGYSRPGDDSVPKNSLDWTLEHIPQLLAQIILQAQIQAMNEKGLEVYAAWQQGCFANDSPEEMVDRAKALMK